MRPFFIQTYLGLQIEARIQRFQLHLRLLDGGQVGLAQHGGADVAVGDLAYGEKRRVEIGLALASEPTLLLLDEPLAGMSPQERAETVQLLKRIRVGRTLIVVEHDMDAIFGLAERITVLCEGRVLADGTPAQIQASKAVQDAYLGGEVVE